MPRQQTTRVIRFLLESLLLRSLIVVVLGVLLVGALASQAEYLIGYLIRHEGRLRGWQLESPVGFFVAVFVIYFVASFVPGTNGKALICGWLFGVLAAVVLINGASTLAAFVMFYIARYALRGHVESRYAAHVIAIKARIARDGGAYVFLLRVVPIVPYSVLNALMGVTPLSARTFWWATQLGMLPSNLAFAWAGASLPTLQELQNNGWRELVSFQLLGALLLLAALPMIVRYTFRVLYARESQRARKQSDSSAAGI